MRGMKRYGLCEVELLQSTHWNQHAPLHARTFRPGTLRLRETVAAAPNDLTGLRGWGPTTSLPLSSK